MALIRCNECSAQVSDQARSCPHCGAPVSRRLQYRRRHKAQELAGILLLVAGFAAVLLGANGIDVGLPIVGLGAVAMYIGLAWWGLVRLWVWWRRG